MPADQYTKVKRIGKGTFGTVWLVKPRSQPTNLILKEVSMRGLPASERKATMHEVKILQALHHPYIIGYKESFVDRDALCIVMEWAAGGDLDSLISQRKRAMRPFSEPDVLRWSAQLISALAYCHHELRLLHRDLKPANVFLSSTGDVKLGDFGISKLLAFSMDMAQVPRPSPLHAPRPSPPRSPPAAATEARRWRADAVRHAAVHEPRAVRWQGLRALR